MKKELFIGIDFSKSKFDVIVVIRAEQGAIAEETFENNQDGYKNLLRWLRKQSKIKRDNWLFCGEHTGLYSRGLAQFLTKQKLSLWLENPLQIKQSSGIKRIKTDRADSLAIANYAYRFQDKVQPYRLPSKAIESLGLLLSYRKELVKQKVQLEIRSKEIRRVINHNATSREVFESSRRRIESLKKEVKQLEDKIHRIIINSELRENYLLVVSVKGIGLITAVSLIIHTDNFAAFQTVRQIACYCGGAAPVPNESGKINKGMRISHLANKELKTLLTQCARSAVQYDKELMKYYQRKLAEGKLDKLIINNVRNKLICRVFAVVKSKTPYRPDYLNPWKDCA